MGGRTLTLAVSGMLWKRSLVMVDEETESHWSLVLSRAMDGPLKGKRLEMVASVLTDWATWKRRHPETTVLAMERTSGNYDRACYDHPERFVVGVSTATDTAGWTMKEVLDRGVVHGTVGGEPVVVYVDPETKAARIYARSVAGDVLRFVERGGRIVDTTTGSTWDLLAGKAIDGPLAGERLRVRPAMTVRVKHWVAFHPDSHGLSEEQVRSMRRGR